MKTRILPGFIFSLIFSTSLFAQSGNPFLSSQYWAANPSVEAIEDEIAKGHSVTESNSGGFDATTYAILGRAPFETVKYLIDKGNDINKLTHDSRTYVFWAGYRGDLSLVKYLVESGAKMDLRDSHGYTVLLFTANGGHLTPEMGDYLLANGASLENETTESGANAFHLASYRFNDVADVAYFTDKGLDINTKDDVGNSIFYYAARSGNTQLLNDFIDAGVSYKEKNNEGGNAFLSAVRNSNNSLAFFEYLAGLGIDPNVTTDDGYTPLHYLAYGADNTEAIEWFVQHGVNPNEVDKRSGNTPLMNATYYNDTMPVVEYFAARTNNINHQNNDGHSALTRAIRRASAETTSYILALDADPLVLDKEGNNLYSFLVNSFDVDEEDTFVAKFELLRESGLDVTALQGDGKTLYHLAAENEHVTLFKLIAELTSIDVNAKDSDGYTALHHVAMKAKDDASLKYLISIGADKSATTEFEESPFDLAS
ncbi:MAG: ankyrin repeat domain-containing protein [Bacteroidota bacterium]